MNRPDHPSRLMPIPDVQSGSDDRQLAIDQVGIRGLRYPISFADRDGVAQGTIATCNVYVALPEDRKNVAELIIAKQRNGPTGTVDLRFTPSSMRFDNLYRE